LQGSGTGSSDTDGAAEFHKFSEANCCQLVRLHNVKKIALEEAICTLLSS